MQKISMIILAGGASRRMGCDKSDLMIDGKTFLEMQIEKGEKLGISDIILSGYHGEKKYKYPVVTDRIPGKGPLGGLELSALISTVNRAKSDAVILRHSGHEEPLMGIYRTDLADSMLEEITLRKGSVFAFLRKTGYECYESQAEDWYFSNINDPEIYKETVEKHFGQK